MTRQHHAQQGFAAIAAIFLVVVLAALGGFMLTFSNTQQLSSAQDVQGSRVYWAARAGLEWGVDRVINVTPASCVPSNFTVEGFNVVVNCAPTAFVDGGAVTIYQLNSVASIGVAGTNGFIERSVSAAVER